MLVFFSPFSYLIFVIQNVVKSQGEKKIQKPRDIRRKSQNQLPVPGDFYRNQESFGYLISKKTGIFVYATD